MAAVSGGEALSAGFRIIRRAPQAFALWVVFDLVVGFLPSLLLRAVMGGSADPAQGAASSGLIVLITFPLALLTVSVMMSAAFRAQLTPDDNRYFYLRLGRQELWVAGAVIVLAVVWILGFFLALIPLAIVGGIAAAGAGALSGSGGAAIAGSILVAVLLYIAMFAAAIWGFLRLSLMLPLAFTEGRIDIAGAWRLSKGNVWQMLGVWLVIFVIALFAYVVLFGTIFGSLLASVPITQIPTMLEEDPTALQKYTNPGVLLVLGIGFVMVNTALRAAFSGAWAHIYRQLRQAPAVEVFG
jgi:hypothetical protein